MIVVLQASQIPEGAQVTKRNGTKVYKLVSKLTIRHDGDKLIVLQADSIIKTRDGIDLSDVKFLLSADSIEAIAYSKYLEWNVSNTDLIHFLTYPIDEN